MLLHLLCIYSVKSGTFGPHHFAWSSLYHLLIAFLLVLFPQSKSMQLVETESINYTANALPGSTLTPVTCAGSAAGRRMEGMIDGCMDGLHVKEEEGEVTKN